MSWQYLIMNNPRKKTDKILKNIKKDIVKEHGKMYSSIKKDILSVFNNLQITEDMPIEKKMSLVNKDKVLDKLCDKISKDLAKANKSSIDIINDNKTNIYLLNYNDVAKDLNVALKDKINIDNIYYNPYNLLAEKDLLDNVSLSRKVKSEIVSSLLSNENQSQTLKRIKELEQKQVNRLAVISNGETTVVENKAIFDAGETAQKKKRNIWKRWVSVHDNRTRPFHAYADQKEVPLNDYFYINGEHLMFPGDCSLGATAKNTANCRCRIELFEKVSD